MNQVNLSAIGSGPQSSPLCKSLHRQLLRLYGRQLFRKLTLGNPKIALIADHTEQNNISKSIASTGLFKEKILRETFTDTHHFTTDLISSSSFDYLVENLKSKGKTLQITNKKRRERILKLNTTTPLSLKQQTS